jgi:surface protein
MSYMFNEATSFNQDLASWNVDNVSEMRRMFLDATSFDQDLSSWNPVKVTDCWDFADGSGMSISKLPAFENCNP